MSLYANIKFDNSLNSVKSKLVINNIEVPISGRKEKWFTNLPIKEGDKVELVGNTEHVSLDILPYKIYHPDQIAFDNKHKIQEFFLEGEPVFYSLTGNITNPKKCLITFPGVSNFDNINYRLSAMTSLQSRLHDVLILAFQDKESVYGNYMYETKNGFKIKSIVRELISALMLKYNLAPMDLIFYGNSKGASIAIDYIDEFPFSKFFLDIPQLDLYNYLPQNPLMRYSLGENARLYYNYIKTLPELINKNVTYSFAENDFDASRGIPMKSFSGLNVVMLKDMPHSGSAMEFVKRQFSKVIQIVSGRDAVYKKNIDMRFVFVNNKLCASRLLGAFKEESMLGKIYAEIEFYNLDCSYSVSLNKKFDKAVCIYWQKGFDIIKHISVGSYNMRLHVYFDFSEFVYPLNQSVQVNDSDVIVSSTLNSDH
ncbi:hypothetical protein [Kluyvera genomosp. 1]|uniref:hypothetical protein n=1 Tax=Kluyvera genomosp. 1 TaxID=2774053 RepID=UPI000690C7AB|nr:hypothetical protein [Kluyvera genomosp. 1]